MASNPQVPLIVFECFLQEDELRHRITKRNAKRDLAKIQSDATWYDFLTHIHFHAKNPLQHILINTEDLPELNFAKAKEYLPERLETGIL